MKLLRSILQRARPSVPVKSLRAAQRPNDQIPVAVRPVTGLPLAPIRRVRRVTLVAIVAAASAVRAKTTEHAYLSTRHEIDRGRTAPRDLMAPVPETHVDPVTCAFVVVYPTDARHPNDTIFDTVAHDDSRDPLAAEGAFQRNASQAAGEAIARRLEEHEGDRRTIERQVRDLDEQIERSETDRNAAVASQAQAIECGKTPIDAPSSPPSILRIALWRLLEVATVAGEAVNCFAALANSGGLDPSNLSYQFQNGAAPAILGWVVAATGMSAVLFVITEWSFARLAAAFEMCAGPSRLLRIATGLAALVFAFVAVCAIAALRAELGAGSTWYFIFFGAVPLIGGSLVHLRADHLSAARAAARVQRATPKAVDIALRMRSEHEEALIAQRDRLRARTAAISESIQLLHAQMHGAEQALRDIARHERRVVEEWVDSLRAALAVDRRWFEYFATKWNSRELLAPRDPLPPAPALVALRDWRAS
jgi:hypothetical protein